MPDGPSPTARRLQDDQTAALRARDALRLRVVRRARATLQNAQIAARGPLDEDAVIRALKGLVKQHRESIEQFEAGGRDDLAQRERDELAVLTAYLPEEMDGAELERLVAAAIAQVGAAGPSDLGAVMKAVMPAVGGRADGRRVSETVRRLIGA